MNKIDLFRAEIFNIKPRENIGSVEDCGKLVTSDHNMTLTEILNQIKDMQKISIIRDLTQEQRDEEEWLRKEAERKNGELSPDDAENWMWRVVGRPAPPGQGQARRVGEQGRGPGRERRGRGVRGRGRGRGSQ